MNATIAPQDALLARLLGPMLRSAVELANMGLADPGDIDLAMRLGARHAKGPLEYARSLSPEQASVCLGAVHVRQSARADLAIVCSSISG